LSAFSCLLLDCAVRKFDKYTAVDVIRFVGKSIFQNHAAKNLGTIRTGITIFNDLNANNMLPEKESRSATGERLVLRAMILME
jgi:hypothetical protein